MHRGTVPLVMRSLKTCEKSLGPDHLDTAASLIGVALLQWNRDQPEAVVRLAERALGIRLRHLDETAAIQTEQQQFLMSQDLNIDISLLLTVSVKDTRRTSAVYRDLLAWKGRITERQQGLRRALKDDPLFADFRWVTQQWSTVVLSPPLPPSDPLALAAWKAREPEWRRTWESRKGTLDAEHELLEKELAKKSVAFREGLQQRRVEPKDLSRPASELGWIVMGG